MAVTIPLAPLELLQTAPLELGIVWNDGHRSRYNVRNIRLACRCANCIDEWTREKILKEENVPKDIKPRVIESIGRYALKIDWTDGHDTGIYTFDQLRNQCECSECKP
jgi:ATP-binding protein involved in chromosome partitioning